MERKDYADKFRDIKNEILNEIRALVPIDSAHYFTKDFYVHCIEGEVATTEICSAVEVWDGGMVVFIVQREGSTQDEPIEGEAVFGYDSNSFLDILSHLKQDMRKMKLSHLRDIVKQHGGSVDFDGTFDFIIHNGDEDYTCKLTALRIARGGTLEVDDTYDGDKFTNPEEELSDKGLDDLIAYVESKCCKTYEVTISELRSRKVEIQADTFEEAVEKAKELLKTEPLNNEDSNGIEFA